MPHLRVGDEAPTFRLPSTHGEIDLDEQLGSGPVLLVFYPADASPVCTKQLCDYRDNLAMFQDFGIGVLAINTAPLASHEKFARQHELPFPLLSDEGGQICKAYGASGLLGRPKRALFVVGAGRKVLWRKVDLPVFHQSAQDLQEVLPALLAS
jgi:thioredoxin-dependent peroxiredoxin